MQNVPLIIMAFTDKYPGMNIDYRIRGSKMELIDQHREELAQQLEALAKGLRAGSYPFVQTAKE